MEQALPEAERRTAEAIGSGTGIDDNAAVEAIKAERQLANQVRMLHHYDACCPPYSYMPMIVRCGVL